MTFDPDFLGCSSSTDRPVVSPPEVINPKVDLQVSFSRMKETQTIIRFNKDCIYKTGESRLPLRRKLVKQDDGRLLTSVGEMR